MSEQTLVLWTILVTSALGGVFDPRAGWGWFLIMMTLYVAIKFMGGPAP